MKKFILFFTMFFILVKSFSQTTANLVPSKEYYLKKSNNQKTAAWVVLIGGGLLGVIGFNNAKQIANDPNIGFTESFESSIGWTIVGTTGSVLAICSIPLFLSSKQNARKAATLTLNNERILVPHQHITFIKARPTLTLKIEL